MKKIFPVFTFCLVLFILFEKTTPNITQPLPFIKKEEDKKFNPGDQVQWIDFQPLKHLSDPSWGIFLTDIENHVPPSMGTTYRDINKTTWAHESSHGIHSYLNNTYRKGTRSYGMYVGNNKAAMIPQPNIKISDVAKKIPQSFRKVRYQLYLIDQAKEWNNDPLYVYDEWNAYVNGATTGIELNILEGTDYLFSCLEFNVYSLYLCLTAKELDPSYDSKQLLEFTAWNSVRSMTLYNKGKDVYLQEVQQNAELRTFVINTWGAAWAEKTFGFKN
jgi:hypothetical protein